MDYPTYDMELDLMTQGFKKIVGVDEVGRGSAFSSVVACAVYIPPNTVENFLGKVNDSKKISAKKRTQLCSDIIDKCEIGIGSVDNSTIDMINIYEATKLAMYQAIESISDVDFVLVDGNVVLDKLAVPNRSIIKGDNVSLSIAAASIVAKTIRDSLMLELHKSFPMYGIDKHKGYLTAQHIAALKKYGPTELHRLSFNKVKQ